MIFYETNNQYPYSHTCYDKQDDSQVSPENTTDCIENESNMPLPSGFESYYSNQLSASDSDSQHSEGIDVEFELQPNYYDNIDNRTDSSNGFLIKRYIRKDTEGYITTLVLILMIINFIKEDNLDVTFIMKHVREIFMDKFGLSTEEFDKLYLEDVAIAISDVEHMLYAMRYKGLISDSPYLKDLTYTIFGNIFANSEFNPYPDIFEGTKRFYELSQTM